MEMIQNYRTTLIIMLSFLLTSCATKTSQESRLLPLEGAYNVRDLGGYKAADNKTVKWRTVFRSGDLHHLTDEDLNFLTSIPLKTDIDFRDSAEIAAAPDKTPVSLKKQVFLTIATGNVIDFTKIDSSSVSTLLVEGNKHFVRDNQGQYREFFHLLMEKENAPLLFHCSAGKDRAGFAAVLFLSSLGVNRETIIQDYLLTNQYLKDKYKPITDSIPYLAPLFEVRPEYIQAAFDVIDNEYGGMENYLTQYLEVDLGKMREIYTE